MTSFKDLDLAEPIARAVVDLGYSTPSPIQAQAIPHLLDGRDLLGIAQTGTGKTAAFALPTLDYIWDERGDAPKRGARVLVLAPTRELVGQIADSFQSYGRHMMELSVARVVGGVSIQKQIKRLVHGNDILVATPGRLIDLIDRKAIKLDQVEVLILDEADQMMDMGFIKPLRTIAGHIPKDRQTLFFSATMSGKIRKLADSFLTKPVEVSVAPANTTAERVEQSLIFVEKADKPMMLADVLLRDGVGRALVFTRTKHGADRVVRRLGQIGIRAVAIHGNKSQGQRQRALDAFKESKVDVLVATDVAARGIDIPEITHVINYEIPNVPEQYVHRIGRTARAGAAGRAIALVDKEERAYLKDIQKLLGDKIPVEDAPTDMEERIKVIKARPKVERVDISPVQEPRKGRGKSRKRKGKGGQRGSGQRASGQGGQGGRREGQGGERSRKPRSDAKRDSSRSASSQGKKSHVGAQSEAKSRGERGRGEGRPATKMSGGKMSGGKATFARKPARNATAKPKGGAKPKGRSGSRRAAPKR